MSYIAIVVPDHIELSHTVESLVYILTLVQDNDKVKVFKRWARMPVTEKEIELDVAGEFAVDRVIFQQVMFLDTVSKDRTYFRQY